MVAAQDVHPRAEEPAHNAALLGGDGHGPEGAGPGLVISRSEEVGQLLNQVAPEMDVEQLDAPAEGQHRKVPVQCARQQPDLELVPLEIGATVAGVGVLAVALGVEVAPTDEDQAVEDGEQPVEHDRGPSAGSLRGSIAGGIGGISSRGDEHRLAAGGHHQIEVGAGHQGGVAIPGPPRGHLSVHGHTDQGAGTCRRHGRQYSIVAAVPR